MTEGNHESESTPTTPEAEQVGQHCLVSPFALFAGATYYPAPGWRGHCGQFDTIEAAQKEGERIAEESYGWWQVVDLRKLEIVAGEGSGHTGLFGKVSAG